MAVYTRKQIESGQTSEPVRASVPVEEVQADVPALPELPEPVKRKPRADEPWYYLEHPDNSASNRISTEFELEAGKVVIEMGRVETQSIEIRDELIKRGYRYMNEEF